jgi:hypothetical protein
VLPADYWYFQINIEEEKEFYLKNHYLPAYPPLITHLTAH